MCLAICNTCGTILVLYLQDSGNRFPPLPWGVPQFQLGGLNRGEHPNRHYLVSVLKNSVGLVSVLFSVDFHNRH
jgi:hypothetical protein